MRNLTVAEVLALHDAIIARTGGSPGLRDFGALDSALAQPKATLGGQDLHESLEDKAAALGFSLAQNHPFMDGNKRVSHAAMETFLVLNGAEIAASIDEQERLMLHIASGRYDRKTLAVWLSHHLRRME